MHKFNIGVSLTSSYSTVKKEEKGQELLSCRNSLIRNFHLLQHSFLEEILIFLSFVTSSHCQHSALSHMRSRKELDIRDMSEKAYGSKDNENSQLSLYPEAKLTLYGVIAYIEPAGRALWNCKSLCLYSSLNSKKSSTSHNTRTRLGELECIGRGKLLLERTPSDLGVWLNLSFKYLTRDLVSQNRATQRSRRAVRVALEKSHLGDLLRRSYPWSRLAHTQATSLRGTSLLCHHPISLAVKMYIVFRVRSLRNNISSPLGVVYKIAYSKGLIKPVPNPESKAIGTKLEEYCDFHQAKERAQYCCVELSEEWSRIFIIDNGSIIPPSPKSSVTANLLPKHEATINYLEDDDEKDYTYLINPEEKEAERVEGTALGQI
ncbi:unnamed protein product [Sphenostylis stenocarpa]|uniref:Uncharacterized protein n=1 Tax=Sphenostylis stenocarpa TaxID=92480 RepID=A0AA86SFR1_9FABA|nr:unnamed protein product [Sphenostylis stenocarpa]